MIKKILLCFLIVLWFSSANAQVKQRSSTSLYAGIGYSLVFFTNSIVNDAYPVFNFSNSEFLTELNPYFGVRPARNFGIEISPSFIFTSTQGNSDGFYFNDDVGRRFYAPQQASLFALPINVNAKFYPFMQNLLSPLSNIYVGAGGGIMYIREEVSSYIYADSSQLFYQGTRTNKNSLWNADFQFMAGYGSTSQLGYNFELSYRLVPLSSSNGTIPVPSSRAKDFNSINLSVKLLFNF